MRKLLDMLPEFYGASPQTADLQNALALVIAQMQEARDDYTLQLDVSTATWGLPLWEAAYGIATDVSKPHAYRRTRIISKMRGAGTTTAELVRSVAESFSNGQVEVIERPGEYGFDVKFVGNFGVPPNLDDLMQAIEQVKPAHLVFAYVFVYMIWSQVDPWQIQFAGLDALNLDWKEFERGGWNA